MVSAYTVKIGGSPAAPGNVYTSATRVRYGRGINRNGKFEFDLIGLNGRAEPASGDYVQVLYGATVVWDGFIREIKREIGDILRHLTATDALGELDRRDVDARVAYSAQNEGAIGTDILNQVGITTATSPIRTGTMDAGNVFGAYRVQYANALKALRALASINGRELTAEYDAGTGTTKIHMRSRTGDYAASQATWRAGRDMVGKPTLQTDNWEQLDNARVLGQGSGVDSSDAYGASTGAGGSNKAVVPAKNLNDSTVAGSYAATLKAAFNDARLVIVAPLRFFNLEVDQGINVGDRVTIQDYTGATVGDFRVYFIETDPSYTDGWFTRVTLIRALTSGGANYPALPVVADAQGVTFPGLVDQQALLNDPQTYMQETDLVATAIFDSILGGGNFPSALTVAAGATGAKSIINTPADFGRAEAFWILLSLVVDGTLADMSVDAHAHTLTYDSTAIDSFGDTYDRTNSPTDTTAPGLVLNGPYLITVALTDAVLGPVVARFVLPHLRASQTYVLSAAYPFAAKDSAGGYAIDRITVSVQNLGEVPVTFATSSSCIAYKKPLHKHNP